MLRGDSNPDEDSTLDEWRQAKRYPITEADTINPVVKRLREACISKSGVKVIYYGGTTPGNSRAIQPWVLFRIEGYDCIYLEAFCYLRGESRTFRIDRMTLVSSDVDARPKDMRPTPWKWIKIALMIAFLLIFLRLYF